MSEKQCRRIVRERCGWPWQLICERCARNSPLELHHRKNRSAGGRWDPANIVGLCRDCHHFVTVNPKAAEAEGFHVPEWKEPGRVGVLYHRRLVVSLSPTGTLERLATVV